MCEIVIKYFCGVNAGQIIYIKNIKNNRLDELISNLTYDQNYNAEIIVVIDGKRYFLDDYILTKYLNKLN